jgi:membrane associated rhomboid family serine protease
MDGLDDFRAVLALIGGAIQSLMVYLPGTCWSAHFGGLIYGA